MLRISQSQIDAFNSVALERDIDELAQRLREDHPKEIKQIEAEEDLHEFVCRSHEEALSCEIRLKDYVYLFAEARLLIGAGFHENQSLLPELFCCLSDEKAGEDEKADAISDELAMREVFG